MNITKDLLLASGWEKTDDPTYPFEKKLPNRNPLNDDEETDVKLVIHNLYNTLTVAVMFSDGGMLNFSINEFSDLTTLERMINFYDPPF